MRLLPAPLAHRVAAAGILHLDHLGPEVAEQLAAERAGQQLAELHHPQVVQRPGATAAMLAHAALRSSMVARALNRWARMTDSAQSGSPARAAATISTWWAMLRASAFGM